MRLPSQVQLCSKSASAKVVFDGCVHARGEVTGSSVRRVPSGQRQHSAPLLGSSRRRSTKLPAGQARGASPRVAEANEGPAALAVAGSAHARTAARDSARWIDDIV